MSWPESLRSNNFATPATTSVKVAVIAALAVSLVGALLLAVAGNWFFPAKMWWAFSFLIFIPMSLRLLLAIGVLLACTQLLWVGRMRTGSAASEDARSALSNSSFFGWAWIYILGAGLLFSLFRERTFHGDALLKLQLLSTRTVQTDPYVWKEPLDSLLTYSLVGLLRIWAQPPEVAVAILSVSAGMVYVAAVFYVAKLLSENTGKAALYIVGLLALGSSQLWFGHVENYSLVTAVGFAAVALALGYLQGANALWPVGLAMGLAASLHPQAVFLAPALLLLLDRQRWLRQLITLLLSSLVGPLLTLLGMALLGVPWPTLAGGYAGDPQLFLTPAQMVAPSHLWDILNNLWLVSPLAPLWLGFGLWALWRPLARRDRIFRYLTGVAAGLLLYHLTFQNDLPRQRDWDLFAIVGPGLTLWGLYAWVYLFTASPPLTAPWFSRVALWPALTFASLFTLAWVGVNHTYTLIRPNADQREIYARYRLLDLTVLLPQANVIPPEPICTEPTGCERVALTEFTMPSDGDTRPTIFAHAPARISIPLQVPEERSFLWLSPALDPTAWAWGGDGVTFLVAVESAGREELLWSRHLAPGQPGDLDWQETLIPLDQFRGQAVNLILTTTPGPANDNAADRAGWGLPWLMLGTPDTRVD